MYLLLTSLSLFAWLFSLLVLSTLLWIDVSASTSSIGGSSTSSASFASQKKEYYLKKRNAPDPFVSAAPLVVAAVCQDGVALVALHRTTPEDGTSLMFERNNLLFNDDDESEEEEVFCDLSNASVLRIQPLDEDGTILACVGWRTDCSIVTSKCRSIVTEERDQYGIQIQLDNKDDKERKIQSFAFGQSLANEASRWMAQCHTSDSVRGLSCVGLLTCADGFLCMVDATGSYRARAHALGKGSDLVNQRLLTMDFSKCNVKDGAQTILNILRKTEIVSSSDNNNNNNNNNRIIVEIVLSTRHHPFQRIQLRELKQ